MLLSDLFENDKQLAEKWSAKYKRSINCDNPKGFSQRAHCQGKKKNESIEEGLTARDSVAKWVETFKKSTHPKFKGKTPTDREKMARAAYYRTVQNKKFNEETVTEGPMWDKVKNVATAGIAAGALGYGAMTGQFTGKDQQQPAKAPLEINIPGGDLEQQKPVAQPKAEKVELEPSTATKTNVEMEKLVFITAYRSGIRGTELAQFMAQAAHETLGFQRMAETGSDEYFKRYDIKHDKAKAKILGNVKPGDGMRYRGRGFIQLTGRDNYRRAGEALGIDLENNPKLASQPKVAAQIAVWYWKSRVRSEVKDFSDTIGVTSKINPSMNGLGDRDMNFQHYLQKLAPLVR